MLTITVKIMKASSLKGLLCTENVSKKVPCDSNCYAWSCFPATLVHLNVPVHYIYICLSVSWLTAPEMPPKQFKMLIEPRTVAALALTARRSNHSARSHPQSARSHPQSARSNPHSARFHPHLARSHPHSTRSHPHSARSHPHSARSHPHSARSHPHSARSNPHLSRSHPHSDSSHLFKTWCNSNLSTCKYWPGTTVI
jgi:hypothetical protein